MTSILRFIKQRPSDSQYFLSLITNPTLSVFYSDPAAATNSYVSGAAAGYFSSSTVSYTPPSSGTNGANPIFRDMGVTIVSSLRTFRRVQLLNTDGGSGTTVNGAPGGPGGSSGLGLGIEWSAQDAGNPTPTGQNPGVVGSGVFTQGTSTEGVTGSQATNPYADSSFGVFYFETGANGIGIAQPLVRFG
jgi:hypothetical protein